MRATRRVLVRGVALIYFFFITYCSFEATRSVSLPKVLAAMSSSRVSFTPNKLSTITTTSTKSKLSSPMSPTRFASASIRLSSTSKSLTSPPRSLSAMSSVFKTLMP